MARELAAAEGKAEALKRAESRRVARELAAAEREREEEEAEKRRAEDEYVQISLELEEQERLEEEQQRREKEVQERETLQALSHQAEQLRLIETEQMVYYRES